jgi:indolepyruvate ferredoxin oxidoreductase, beta subunit
MKSSFDVLVVGIGGQGTILASNILGEACVIENRPVRGAETHGMAQRGGSVESHIRIGARFGPIIAPGTTDLVIAFDLLEGLRARHFLREGAPLVVSRDIVVPTSVYAKGDPVPDEGSVLAALSGTRLCLVDAARIALEAGSPLTQNVVMLGAASVLLPLSVESVLEGVRRTVPGKTVAVNEKAFLLGREAGCDSL